MLIQMRSLSKKKKFFNYNPGDFAFVKQHK